MTAERSVPRPLAGSRWWVNRAPPAAPGHEEQDRKEKPHIGRDCLEGGNYPAPERYPNETEEQGQIYCEEWSGPRAAMSYTGSVISYDVAT